MQPQLLDPCASRVPADPLIGAAYFAWFVTNPIQALMRLWGDELGVEKVGSYESKVRKDASGVMISGLGCIPFPLSFQYSSYTMWMYRLTKPTRCAADSPRLA